MKPSRPGDISKHAPRIITIRVPTEKIRDIIGPGGKNFLMGRLNIASSDNDASAKAIAIIQELTATPEVDKTYLGRVERIILKERA